MRRETAFREVCVRHSAATLAASTRCGVMRIPVVTVVTKCWLTGVLAVAYPHRLEVKLVVLLSSTSDRNCEFHMREYV